MGDDKFNLPSDADIEARFVKIRDNLPDLNASDPVVEQVESRLAEINADLEGGAVAPTDDEIFAAKADALKARANLIQTKHEATQKIETADRKSSAESAAGLGVGLMMSYAIIGLPIIGAGIGWLANRQIGATQWTGIGATVGFVVAIAYVLVALKQQNAGK
jgi:F0F1-type ATP synthase assembly protein I